MYKTVKLCVTLQSLHCFEKFIYVIPGAPSFIHEEKYHAFPSELSLNQHPDFILGGHHLATTSSFSVNVTEGLAPGS